MRELQKNLSLYDNKYETELETKLKLLNTKISEITSNKEDFYNTINKTKIDELLDSIKSCGEAEKLIFNTIKSLNSLKANHEESAAIFVKINELLDQNASISSQLDRNTIILNAFNSNMKDNNTRLKKNISSLRSRIEKLNSK